MVAELTVLSPFLLIFNCFRATSVSGMLSGSLVSSLKDRSSSVRAEQLLRLSPSVNVSRTFRPRSTDSKEQLEGMLSALGEDTIYAEQTCISTDGRFHKNIREYFSHSADQMLFQEKSTIRNSVKPSRSCG